MNGGFRDIVCNDTLRFQSAGGLPLTVPTPDSCRFNLKQKSDKATWLVDLDYKPIDDVLLYAKYARGYRQGGINMTNVGIEIWGPEKVDTYEVGAKTSFGGPVPGSRSGNTSVLGPADNETAQLRSKLATAACAAAASVH